MLSISPEDLGSDFDQILTISQETADNPSKLLKMFPKIEVTSIPPSLQEKLYRDHKHAGTAYIQKNEHMAPNSFLFLLRLKSTPYRAARRRKKRKKGKEWGSHRVNEYKKLDQIFIDGVCYRPGNYICVSHKKPKRDGMMQGYIRHIGKNQIWAQLKPRHSKILQIPGRMDTFQVEIPLEDVRKGFIKISMKHSSSGAAKKRTF